MLFRSEACDAGRVSVNGKPACPLHGPVLTENLGHYISLYDTWSSYTPEEEGIVVAYTSVYGHKMCIRDSGGIIQINPLIFMVTFAWSFL